MITIGECHTSIALYTKSISSTGYIHIRANLYSINSFRHRNDITICINNGTGWPRINTTAQLTDEVVDLAPVVLYENRAPFANRIEIVAGEQEVSQEELDSFMLPYGQSEESEEMARSILSLKRPNTMTKTCGPVIALVTVEGGAVIAPGAEKKLTIRRKWHCHQHPNCPNPRQNRNPDFTAKFHI